MEPGPGSSRHPVELCRGAQRPRASSVTPPGLRHGPVALRTTLSHPQPAPSCAAVTALQKAVT